MPFDKRMGKPQKSIMKFFILKIIEMNYYKKRILQICEFGILRSQKIYVRYLMPIGQKLLINKNNDQLIYLHKFSRKLFFLLN